MQDFKTIFNALTVRQQYIYAFFFFNCWRYTYKDKVRNFFTDKNIAHCAKASKEEVEKDLSELKTKGLLEKLHSYSWEMPSYKITPQSYEDNCFLVAHHVVQDFIYAHVLPEKSHLETYYKERYNFYAGNSYNYAKLIVYLLTPGKGTETLQNVLRTFSALELSYLYRILATVFGTKPACPGYLPPAYNYIFLLLRLEDGHLEAHSLEEELACLPPLGELPKKSYSEYFFLNYVYPILAGIGFLRMDMSSFPIVDEQIIGKIPYLLNVFLAKRGIKVAQRQYHSYANRNLCDFFSYNNMFFKNIVGFFMLNIVYGDQNIVAFGDEQEYFEKLGLDEMLRDIANYRFSFELRKKYQPFTPQIRLQDMLKAALYAAIYCLPEKSRPLSFNDEYARSLADYAVSISRLGYNFPALVILTALQEKLAEGSEARKLWQKLEGKTTFVSPIRPGLFPQKDALLLDELTKLFGNSEQNAVSPKKPSPCRLNMKIYVQKIHTSSATKFNEDFFDFVLAGANYNQLLKSARYSVSRSLINLLEKKVVLSERFSEEDCRIIEDMRSDGSFPINQRVLNSSNLHVLETKDYWYSVENLVFHDESENTPPCQVIMTKPGVSMKNMENGQLKLEAKFPLDFDDENKIIDGKTYLFKRITGTQWQCIVWDAKGIALVRIFRRLGAIDKNGRPYLVLKPEQLDAFKALLPNMFSMLDMGGEALSLQTENMEHQPANVALVLTVKGSDELQFFELFLRNKSWDEPPLLMPIQGGDDSVIVECKEKQIVIDRNRKAEKMQAKAFVEHCVSLEDASAGNYRWTFSSIEQLLELLGEMETLENPPIIDWQGMKPVSCKEVNCVFRVNSGLAWFDIGADIQVDEKRMMALARFLDIFSTSDGGNYICVGERKYIHLTRQLRAMLDALRIGLPTKENIRIDSGALPAFQKALPKNSEEFLPEELVQRLKKIKEAMQLKPELPKGLQCTLREYQVQGYQWLAKMGTAGIGVCLADDMGVGKTLQLLTLLLERGKQGPSLVFAPASVCRNWQVEAQKFTRGLVLTLLGETDRKASVNSAGPYDVLVVSYGLLATCAELLETRKWNCLVLDEAQAIKNFQSKRSQCIKKLKADFRITATGTPVENNLFEYWNMFDFLNPGMLGSHEHFQERWMTGNSMKPQLKLVTSPLILRRMKADVLSELPSKTEINIEVQLSETERLLYEKLRRDAIATIDSSGETGGKAAMQILVQLTKLRRFCCHPSLAIDKLAKTDTAYNGAKIEQLMELAQDLKESGHSALVFSQYVDMLAIVRRRFDEAGFSYNYLDGSTPAKVRQNIVDDFQRGEKDFFLISLKAGGLGLNLTAASYVILMDPWWNPAVENQAADRVYRIGQHNPVTIYRLFTKNTVEERVLELQEQKRLLANELLDGQGTENKLSPEMLLQLLKE